MTGLERITAALKGEQADTVPIMLHNFMMAARQAGLTQTQYRSDPQSIARAFIESVERYKYDGILVDIDTATLAGAVGVPVEYLDDDPAVCHVGCIDDLSAVASLPDPDVGADEHIQIWLEAVRLLADHFGDEICVRGNCDQGPFALACMMRGMQNWMMDLMDPGAEDNVLALLEYCTEATSQFVNLMSKTGAHVISNGDSPAGPSMISPAMYRQFGLPYEQRIVAVSHAAGLPYILHICGDTSLILDDILETGADAMELDYKTDVTAACEKMAGKMCFVGNIDPSGVLGLGSVQDVERETVKLLDVFADNPRFILNAGCALPPETPSENIETMIKIARSR
ncbi:MAG: uroporphyrinogen decarboxylase family protein [Phycisphaerae bacterium]|nr:uroporphyrinogen decarboxylase family protein [Phycisphaerae bacterium]